MKTYIVENTTKKSIEEIETWKKDDEYVTITTLWRGGSYTIETDEILESTEDTFVVSDYEIADLSVYDGCSMDFEGNLADEVEHLYEDGGYMEIETAGWDHVDTETIIYNGVEIREG